MPESVLIIEDDPQILTMLRETVDDLQLACECVANGREGAERALSKPFDLLLVDVNLPGMDGFQICQAVKFRLPQMPIIMVTSRADEADKIMGLNLGADDYIVKPFSRKELQARIRALLRRVRNTEVKASNELVFGPMTIDVDRSLVTISGKQIQLTLLEFDLLLHLAREPGKIHTREDLIRNLWGYESPEFARSITTYLSRLRSKIEVNPKHPTYIRTVYGKGYRFSIELKK